MEALQTMDIARVVSAKKLKDSGLGIGDVVMLIGSRDVPAKKSDPYLFRKLFVVAKVGEDDLPQLPKDSNDYRAYLLDPRSLERVTDDERDAVLDAIGDR